MDLSTLPWLLLGLTTIIYILYDWVLEWYTEGKESNDD